MSRMNEHHQPIGEAVDNWTKRKFPGDMCAVGTYTTITKLTAKHIPALCKVFAQTEARHWTYLSEAYSTDEKTLAQMLHEKITSTSKVCYVVLNQQTNEPIGIFSLMRIDQDNGVIEVGNVIFSTALQGTRMSTEAHQLLASYVFDELQYRRYEWKCDALNAPSIKAAKRLGFTYEGTFRKAVIYKNRSRDTCWFSMLQEEWPLHKQAMTKWLDEDNFDEHGQQIRKLEAVRENLRCDDI